MASGLRSTADLRLPVGVDLAYLRSITTADGVTYEEVIGDIRAALQLFNGRENPVKQQLCFINNEAVVQSAQGTMEVERHTEYRGPRPQRVGGAYQHAVGIAAYDIALGWTWDYLRKANRTQIENDIAAAMLAWDNHYERSVLQRFFRVEDEPAGGSFSPGFVGAGSLVFEPRPYGGRVFGTNHTHYLRYDNDAAGWAAGLDAMEKHLAEHGIAYPFELWINDADEAIVRSLAGFVQRPDTLIVPSALDPRALVSDLYIGAYKNLRIRLVPRVPAGYAAAFKLYGANDPRNPLRWVYNVTDGDNVIMMGTGQGMQQFPLEHAYMFREFGVGTNDRVGAVLTKFAASGVYTSPTIT